MGGSGYPSSVWRRVEEVLIVALCEERQHGGPVLNLLKTVCDCKLMGDQHARPAATGLLSLL